MTCDEQKKKMRGMDSSFGLAPTQLERGNQNDMYIYSTTATDTGYG